jgi:hypothetical protein
MGYASGLCLYGVTESSDMPRARAYLRAYASSARTPGDGHSINVNLEGVRPACDRKRVSYRRMTKNAYFAGGR